MCGEGRPGLGKAFVKWLWDNQGFDTACHKVDTTSACKGWRGYKEFPNDERLRRFDRSDHKFVAVACACEENPLVLNSVDSDWWDHLETLSENGVHVHCLCERTGR